MQAQQTLWTKHCGIISFSNDFVLTQIPTEQYYASDRYILCQVHHPHAFYTPFYILNIYAPANPKSERRTFFHSMYQLIRQLSDTIPLDQLIISGDFNYDNGRDIESGNGLYKTSQEWVLFLQRSFYNCMLFNNMDRIPTFQRGEGPTSTIDYVYAGLNFSNCVSDASVQYIKSQWSDHSILNVVFDLGVSKMGPGLWRGNPSYAAHPVFQELLAKRIDELMAKTSGEESPQSLWESIKKTTKKCIKSFGFIMFRGASHL
jgi:hypothetical protein